MADMSPEEQHTVLYYFSLTLLQLFRCCFVMSSIEGVAVFQHFLVFCMPQDSMRGVVMIPRDKILGAAEVEI
jgi:hypothetical protein